jgi:D-arabinose 1-dehydrogenase-like Zn-dependent alcohol dehydrogenase
VLGNELAGEVVAVGSDVKRFRVGDRVFARVAKDRAGAVAEQACVDENDAALMPRNLDFTAAAAEPLAGLTALQALRDELGIKPGQKVFISGGAGGVGTFAIQIAKWLGAHVTTTASQRGDPAPIAPLPRGLTTASAEQPHAPHVDLPVPALVQNLGLITIEDAIEQTWIEGRRQFAAKFRAQYHPETELGTSYELALKEGTVDERRTYWLAMFKDTNPILHAFRDDPFLISGLELKLACKLRENDI